LERLNEIKPFSFDERGICGARSDEGCFRELQPLRGHLLEDGAGLLIGCHLCQLKRRRRSGTARLWDFGALRRRRWMMRGKYDRVAADAIDDLRLPEKTALNA
jgi:hypothetical protein